MQKKVNQKIVIFDFDDTLVPNVVYYRETKQRILKLFKKFFGNDINEKKFLEDYGAIDLNKSKKLALSRSRFPLSAVELYMKYCEQFGRDVVAEDVDEVFTTANTVFDVVEELSDETTEIIKTIINEGYKVYLLTSGDEVVQSFKIYKSKVYQLLDNENIIIVPEKNDSVYENFFKKYGFENCCMIGNSRKGDINPALNVGMFAIYVPENTWEYEYEKLKESDKLYTIHTLSTIPKILDEIFTENVEQAV